MSRLARIGLFFLIIGVGGISYIMMSSQTFSPRDTYTVEVLMDDASGLTTNSQVQMAGVAIGHIDKIELENGRARLTLAISKDVELYEDAEVAKQPSSLLGTSVISMRPGAAGARVEDGARIERSVSRGDFGHTMDVVDALGGEFTEFVRELRAELLTERVYGDIGAIVENVRYTSESTRVLIEQNLQTLGAMLASIDRIVDEVELRSEDELNRVARILESTAVIVERFESVIDSHDQDLVGSIKAVRRSAETLSTTMESVSLSAADVSDITGTVRRGEGTVGRAVYDEELYERVSRIAAGAEEIVEGIVGLGVQFGYEGAYLSRDDAARNEFALRLPPRTRDRYYELGVVDTPRGPSRTTTTETVETIDGDTSESTITETETTDGVRFNAQIARVLGPLTLRGGLIESTGGFGVDLRPVDQFMLSGEMFSFGDDTPNLRASGSFFPFFDPDGSKPWEWIYLTGGIDRVLDEDERQLFLGGGLRVTDDSLRGLFSLAPLAGAAQ